MKRKKLSNQNEITSLVGYAATTDDKAAAFHGELMNPKNKGKSIKTIAISCGLNMQQMVQIYREGALVEAFCRSADVIAKHTEGVVKSTMVRAEDPESSHLDKRVALELCGMLPGKNMDTKVNISMNQHGGHPSFEDSAKKGTISINAIPEEECTPKT
jgi:hypothetical protein